MKYGENFHNETSQNDHRSERDAKEPKAVRFRIKCHHDESDGEYNQSGDHKLVILFSEGEFAHVNTIRPVITSGTFEQRATC